MSAEFPTLAEVIARGTFMAASVVGDHRFNEGLWERTSEMMREDCRRDARAALDTLREACTVRTVEQLDELPVGSVIRVPLGGITCALVQRFADTWRCDGRPWPVRLSLSGYGDTLLIWHPDWAQS